MHELFPVVAGILVGVIASRVAATRLRYIVGAVLTLLFGAAATMLSGEAVESWAFVLVDIGLVALAAFIAYGAITLVERRLTQPR